MVSLKKEFCSSLYSLLPIIVNDTGLSLEVAVSMALNDFAECSDQFDSACERLMAFTGDDPESHDKMMRYLDVLRMNLTGDVYWR